MLVYWSLKKKKKLQKMRYNKTEQFPIYVQAYIQSRKK